MYECPLVCFILIVDTLYNQKIRYMTFINPSALWDFVRWCGVNDSSQCENIIKQRVLNFFALYLYVYK